MPITHIPKYPIVDPDPSIGRAIAHFNARDWLNVALFTSTGFTFAWFHSSKQLRGVNSKFLAFTGFTAGMFYACQNSVQRFIGVEPNDRLVELYGPCSAEKLAKQEMLARNPGMELIDSDITN